MYRCRLTVETTRKGGRPDGDMIIRDVDLPFAPFIGLTIGSQLVEGVYLLQGDTDSGIEVRLEPVDRKTAEIWIKDGSWQWAAR